MPGHTTDTCRTLKNAIQDLIDSGKIDDPERWPNVKTNPLSNYWTMPLPIINTISSGLLETFTEELIQPIQETLEEQEARAEKEFLMISEDEILNLILDCWHSNEDEQDPSTFEYISMPRAFTPHLMMQMRTRYIAFLMNG